MVFNQDIKATNKVYLFFLLIIIEIVFISLILSFIFSLNLELIFTLDKIPQYIQNTYVGLLYLSIISNLYLLDKDGFLSVFKISKKELKYFFESNFYGFLSLILFIYINLLFGLLSVEKSFNLEIIPIIFITSILIGFSEELLFRNFIFKNLNLDLSETKAIIVSSYIYAQLHFLRFDLNFYQIITPLISLFLIGFILSTLYKKIGFWYSVGLHSGWVFVISYINQSNILNHNNDYLFLSGGNYPPSGLICLFILLVSSVFLKQKKQ
jgi:membrane protease YdiL (CAAX protease family)